jgi:hypothetical protein
MSDRTYADLEVTTKAEIVPLTPPPAAPTPFSVLHEAVQRGANVEVLTKLLELQERWEANQARKAFDEAFAAFKAEAPKLERSKEVSFGQGKAAYKYTPLDVIANTLGPILAKHGLSYNWRQAQSDGAITVTCVLKHVQGHSDNNTLTGPADSSGSKNPIQSIGSGVAYLRRYTLLGVLGMATSDEDHDGMTMGNATDFIANIETASNKEELAKRYKEAVTGALQAKDPNAVKVFMKAREKREAELRA